MSDRNAAKNSLPGYQRWEMASFGSKNAHDNIALTTAEQVERIHLQSREEGHAAGYQEGSAQAGQEVQRLQALLAALEPALRKLDQTVADELLALALDIARQMLGQALKVHPELVLPVIREAIRCLPQFNQTLHLVVHPQDALLVRSNFTEPTTPDGWVIIDDARIERGGCRVETPSSEVDATMQTRWRRVLATLGSKDEWLTS